MDNCIIKKVKICEQVIAYSVTPVKGYKLLKHNGDTVDTFKSVTIPVSIFEEYIKDIEAVEVTEDDTSDNF